jgi:hypothetical protein
MEKWINALLEHKPVSLVFAARDGTLPEGDGGVYYLAFQAAAVSSFEELIALELVVMPGNPEGVIDFFGFGSTGVGGLQWAQINLTNAHQESADVLGNLTLVAPESVSSWRDIDGNTGVPTVVRPESAAQTPTPGIPDGVRPSGTVTGISAVDAFLARAYAGDLSSVAPDAVFVLTRCGASVDLPPCDPGDLPNTPYDVVGVYNCDKHFARSVEELEDALEEIDREGPQYLLFVLAPERAPGPYREAAGEYIVGLRTGSYPRRTFYLDKDGRLLTIDSCPGSYPNFSYGHVPPEAIILAPP